MFSDTKVLARYKDKAVCEIEEVFINKSAEMGVTKPSVTLHASEMEYLDTHQ